MSLWSHRNREENILKREKKKRLYYYLCKNDISVRIYLSFVFVLIVTLVLTGLIFNQMYQKNYINSHTELLTKQGKKVARRVAKFYANDKLSQYEKYNVYLDELEKADKTDVWIVSNHEAAKPLSEDYTNADMTDGTLTKEMNRVLEGAFRGKVTASSSYDKAYGMMILRVAIPIQDPDTSQVIGGVMMVSMVDKQTMGLDEGKYLITVSAFVAILISFVIAFVLTRYLSLPLNKIHRNIMKLSSGEYSEIVTYSRSKQLAVIEERLNELSSQLAKAEIERENLEQARRDFFANVSHELRTPITVIRGYAESLHDGVVVDPQGVDGLYQRILTECQGMERLVEDLFVLSKMQNPDFEIAKEPVSLRQIFLDVIRSGRIIGQEKQLDLEMDMPEEDPCMIFGDYDRLRQMFLIIVDNAVKFSHRYGKIRIKVQKAEGRLEISIQDEGIGIAEEQQPYIFEKFYKSKMRQNEKGTGLGLMIAKQIALRHDGEIWVESEIGKGSTFYFVFTELTSMEEYE